MNAALNNFASRLILNVGKHFPDAQVHERVRNVGWTSECSYESYPDGLTARVIQVNFNVDDLAQAPHLGNIITPDMIGGRDLSMVKAVALCIWIPEDLDALRNRWTLPTPICVLSARTGYNRTPFVAITPDNEFTYGMHG